MSCSSCSRNVAVPDVFVAAHARADRHLERHRRQIELHGHHRHLVRVDANRLLQTQLVRVWTAQRTREIRLPVVVDGIERLPADQRDVDQVEVDGVGITREVEDAPDFRVAGVRRLGRRIHVRASEAIAKHRRRTLLESKSTTVKRQECSRTGGGLQEASSIQRHSKPFSTEVGC